MSMQQNKNVMNCLVNLTVILLFTFVFVHVASAGNNPEFVNITIDGSESIIFANHSDSITDGNWISLSGGDPMQLPSPFTLTYNGINSAISTNNGKTINVAIDIDDYSNYVITYPYDTHDMFTNVSGKNNVTIRFNGTTSFANDGIDVFLIETGVTSLKDAFNDITNGYSTNFRNMLDNAQSKELNKILDGNGDGNLNFGTVDAGDYVVFILLNSSYLSDPNDMSILSATTFQVLEYDSTITVQSRATLGSTFYVGIDLLNASSGTYTYGAVLVHESAYRAEMQLKFDGTRAGTNLTQNGADIIQGYEIAGIGLSSVNKTTVQNIITDGIGSNNGSVTYKTTSTNSTSIPLVTSELRAGNYILLTGVYKSGKMLVAFNQCEILISTDRSSSSSGSSSASTKPYESVALKDVVSLYVNIGDNIKYDFKEDENPIGFVSFDAKTNVGYVTATIEVLNDISTLISAPPTGEIYKNINIWIRGSGYATEENIVNPVIGFKVAKLWISENGIDESTIKLNRYNSDKWNPLPTTKTGEDVNYIYFSSKTPGFSPFAITGQKKTHVAPTPAVLHEEPAEAITPAPEVEVPPEEPTPWWKYLLIGAVILLIIAGAYLYLQKQQS